MSRTQKLKGLSAASLRLKTLNDNPYLISETVTIFIAFVNSLSIFRTSWQAEYYRKVWLTAHYSIRGVPTPILTFSCRYPFTLGLISVVTGGLHFSLYRQITKSNYKTIILARSLSRKILLSSRIVQPLVASQSRFLQKTQFSLTFLSLLVD